VQRDNTPPSGSSTATTAQERAVELAAADAEPGDDLWTEDRTATENGGSVLLTLPYQWCRMQDVDVTETGVSITVYADRIEVVPRE
jgi:hypothetical protein